MRNWIHLVIFLVPLWAEAAESRYQYTPDLNDQIESMRVALKKYDHQVSKIGKSLEVLLDQENEILGKIKDQKGLFSKLMMQIRSYKEPLPLNFVLSSSSIRNALHTQIGVRFWHDITKGVFKPLLEALQQIITLRKERQELQKKQKEIMILYRSISDQLSAILNQTNGVPF